LQSASGLSILDGDGSKAVGFGVPIAEFSITRRNRLSRIRILLADDHREFLSGIQAVLSAQYDVVGAVEDGDALVRAAQSTAPDLIISDLSMPVMNGLQAAIKLKELGLQVKIIFLTVQSSPSYAKRAMKVGASGYVLKPYADEQLPVAIQEVLAGQRYISPEIAI
jgi:DNA-binding NarL/FixJ family response regulator